MKDRINLLIKAKNLTAAQFADEIGVQKSSISHIISGRNNASLDFIQKILLCYPEVSMDWLMFGKGPIFKSPETSLNSNNDGSLNIVQSPDLPPVDLFSELIPATSADFRKENDLNPDQNSDGKLKNKDIEKESLFPAGETKENKMGLSYEYPVNRTGGSGHKNNPTKTLVKIVEFYSDNTYREYFPE
jgi:transcriptional regulator with XRE-family HTH domain